MPRIYKTYKCKLCEVTFKGQHSDVHYKMENHIRQVHGDLFTTISKQRDNYNAEFYAAIQRIEIDLALKYPLYKLSNQFDFVPTKH
jgi:hypothetical protein